VFLNKSTKSMPYLNRPWKGQCVKELLMLLILLMNIHE
jgi:hypothetical protein